MTLGDAHQLAVSAREHAAPTAVRHAPPAVGVKLGDDMAIVVRAKQEDQAGRDAGYLAQANEHAGLLVAPAEA